ncbi:MAG: carboxymuconolactone decarboxylase family protein [Bacteroidota bacterium]
MKNLFLLVFALFFTVALSAQNSMDKEIKQAKQEIEASFGTYPTLFKIIPDYQVPGMWAYFKACNSPQNAIPPKYRELINLAVAAQIPCDYCIYYHTESAKAFGATEDEIKEALVVSSGTRAFSMIIQGNGVDLEEFKKEFDGMMAYMAKQATKKM